MWVSVCWVGQNLRACVGGVGGEPEARVGADEGGRGKVEQGYRRVDWVGAGSEGYGVC